MYGVARKRADLLRMLLVTTAAMLAIWVLALVETPNSAEATSLSQNGKIVFDRSTPSGDQSIYAVDPDGSSLSLLAKEAGMPAWSPDGTKIAYTNYREVRGGAWSEDVYVMNVDGSRKSNLTSTSAREWHPRWSPDGAKIIFSSEMDGDMDIYTMDADGSNVTQVTKNSDALDINADWQPLPGTTVIHQPDTGGPSVLLVATALLLSGGVMFYSGVNRRM